MIKPIYYTYIHFVLENNEWNMFYFGRGSYIGTPDYIRASTSHKNQTRWNKRVKDKKWTYIIFSDNISRQEACYTEELFFRSFGRIDYDEGGILTNKHIRGGTGMMTIKERRLRDKEYYRNNIIKKKKYLKDNKEKIKVRKRRQYLKNKEDYMKNGINYYEKNKEKLKEGFKTYYQKNKEKIRIKSMERYRQKKLLSL